MGGGCAEEGLCEDFFTSESVTEGHPDKVCDQISDAVLDAVLSHDPDSRAAIECCATTGMVLVMGELSTDCYVDISKIVRDTVKGIGYTQGHGFSYNSLAVITAIHGQSADIAMGVDASVESRAGGDDFDRIGAGDQGMMFGYAVNETEELMPLTAVLAQKLAKRLIDIRIERAAALPAPGRQDAGHRRIRGEKAGARGYGRRLCTARRVRLAGAAARGYPQVRHRCGDRSCAAGRKYKIFHQSDRPVEIGGAGRGQRADRTQDHRRYLRRAVCAHGGGSFSGKDATKVDRSATYMARYVCKNIVAAGLADECELQIAYAIGVAHPVSLFVDTFGTGRVPDDELVRIVRENFDLRPQAIIEKLGLRRPIFRETAAYGHFGRAQFPWEQTDMAETLKKYL